MGAVRNFDAGGSNNAIYSTSGTKEMVIALGNIPLNLNLLCFQFGLGWKL